MPTDPVEQSALFGAGFGVVHPSPKPAGLSPLHETLLPTTDGAKREPARSSSASEVLKSAI